MYRAESHGFIADAEGRHVAVFHESETDLRDRVVALLNGQTDPGATGLIQHYSCRHDNQNVKRQLIDGRGSIKGIVGDPELAEKIASLLNEAEWQRTTRRP